MKVGLFLFALVVLGGVAANPSYAQQPYQGTAKIVKKPPHVNPIGSPLSRHGTLGGPVSKGAKINGTGMRPKH